VFVMPPPPMNTPVREGETIEGSRTMRNVSTLSSAQVLKITGAAKFTPRATTYVFVNVVGPPLRPTSHECNWVAGGYNTSPPHTHQTCSDGLTRSHSCITSSRPRNAVSSPKGRLLRLERLVFVVCPESGWAYIAGIQKIKAFVSSSKINSSFHPNKTQMYVCM